ncbi:MAG: T9SS type A sorting domain-containing protein [Bacteroidota bacterium]
MKLVWCILPLWAMAPLIAQPIVTLDPTTRYQTILGLGGSLAFSEQFLNTMPQSSFDHLVWRLFDDLHLNIIRVRMRNEIEPVNDNTNPDSIAWSNVRPLPDTAAIKFVRAARQGGRDIEVLATPWSPPSWMKTNDSTVNGGHVRAGMEAELSEWIRIFLLVWKDRYGIPIQILSLQNEPSWVASYESCIYTPAEINRALRIVVPRLRIWGFDSLKIIGPDDASAEASLTFADSLLIPTDIRSMLSGFAVHNYSTQYTSPEAKISLLQTIRQRCSNAGVSVWHTEYSNLNNTSAGSLYEAHLEAWHWFVALNDLGSSTYLHWQLAASKRSSAPSLGTALVQYNTDNNTFTISKKYFFVKHFTHFIRAGMIRVDLSGFPAGIRGTAFLDVAQNRGVGVIQNSTSLPRSVRFLWPGADTLLQWRSSRTDTCVQFLPLIRNGSYFDLTMADSSIVTLTGSMQGTNTVRLAELPSAFRLDQNCPNPFNPTTTIRFQIPNSSFVTLKIFDLLGREVATLVNDSQQPGEHSVTFDATSLPSGVYVYRQQTGHTTLSKQMLLLK